MDVDLHMLTVRAKTIRDLAHCVKRCDLELAGVASAAYVSGRSTLVEDEQELEQFVLTSVAAPQAILFFLKSI